MKLLAANVAVLRTEAWTGRLGRTGIDKRPVDGPVRAGFTGMAGDTVCDTKHHGGADRAAYAYAHEDLRWWSTELGRPLSPGMFGENLTTSGLAVTGALLGERWAIGGAVFEVSGPRTPCRVFAGFWDVPDLVRRFTERGRPGAYLRVVTEGDVAAGDPIQVVHRPDHGVTVGRAFRALTTRPDLLVDVAEVAYLLPADTQLAVRRRLEPVPA
jgi:MOSC domain-containing protein YiiM